MPSQLKSVQSGKCATEDIGRQDLIQQDKIQTDPETKAPIDNANRIVEEDEEEEGGAEVLTGMKPPTPVETSPDPGYTWRIDLAGTEAHWPGWFKGLSDKFLSIPAFKLLLLAGVDRLDK